MSNSHPNRSKKNTGKPFKNPKGPKITPQMQRFIDEYLVDLNGRQAAIRAGYSKSTSHVAANGLLKHVLVKAAIDTAIAARSLRTEITADWVLKELHSEYLELKAMNQARVSDIYNDDGSLKPIGEWPDIWQTKQMIQDYEVEETFDAVQDAFNRGTSKSKKLTGYTKKVRSAELKKQQLKTLELIGRHVGVGAFKDVPMGASTGDITLKVEYVDVKPTVRVDPQSLFTSSPKPEKANGHATE